MSTDVIGTRYRLGGVVACTPEVTTWQARDIWLDEGVLVVTPEPGCGARFVALSEAVMDRASAHLLPPYDIGSLPDPFVVFDVPNSTFSDGHAPRDEEDVLAAGKALGDALEALHGRGVVHGELHPGAIVLSAEGDATLSPWPLAPRPENWSEPGGFGSAPDERPNVSPQDDLRALGAVLLGALAGPPLLSNQQVDNLERELAVRAPSAVAIADRALTPPVQGGYEEAAELRDDCEAALSGLPVGLGDPIEEPRVADLPNFGVRVPAEPARIEGRRAALVVAAAGAAVLAGLGVSGAVGAHPGAGVHPVTGREAACAGPPSTHCDTTARSAPGGQAAPVVARSSAGAHARLADEQVVGRPAGDAASAASPASAASANAPSPLTRSPATSTTTTQVSGATTTSPPATSSTTTSTPPSTTTSTPTTTSTTAPSPTTTSSSDPSAMQAGSNGNGAPSPGSGGVAGPNGHSFGPSQGR